MPFINPLDYETYDEFKWYLVSDLNEKIDDLSVISPEKEIALTKKRLQLANVVRHSPRFSWNVKNKLGKIQLKATVNFLAENNLLGIHHNFEWQDIGEKRDEEIVQHLNQKIENYNQFFRYKKNPPPEFEE